MAETATVIDAIDLDHVALAVEHHDDALPRYMGDLGGVWQAGEKAIGFAPVQLAYGNGMRLELLAPHAVERNDFLRRFLDTSGAGPHHLTFKVADIAAALAACADVGLTPVGVDLADPEWKEAFLHPKDALGIVVQLAQSTSAGWSTPVPDDCPPSRPPAPASLDRVVYAVADLDAGLALFSGLLGGTETLPGDHDGPPSVDLAWKGPGRLRLVEREPGSADLGGRTGRLHHLAFSVHDPSLVAGAEPVGATGCHEVEPEHNVGVRLHLCPRG